MADAPYRFAAPIPPGVDPVPGPYRFAVPAASTRSSRDPARSPSGTTRGRLAWSAVAERVRVVVDGVAIADTTHALRVLETAGAPVYYLPARR